MDEKPETSPMGQVIQIDEARIRDHLGEMVRGTVEEALNAMLDAEADRLCGAGRYERSEARKDTRAGSYERSLETRAGQVSLKIPKLRRQTFETAIIERYRRRESSVEEALIEMYLAGVSVRRVEDITEALWGTRVSPSTVSNLNKKIYAKIEAWRNRPIEGAHPYVFLDGIVMKRTWASEVRNVSPLVAIGVNGEGFREILGICEGAKEDKSGWSRCVVGLLKKCPHLDSLHPVEARREGADAGATGAGTAGVLRLRLAAGPGPGRPHPRARRSGARSRMAARGGVRALCA
jgi:putative transposase